jgi:hypothetical protein
MKPRTPTSMLNEMSKRKIYVEENFNWLKAPDDIGSSPFPIPTIFKVDHSDWHE